MPSPFPEILSDLEGGRETALIETCRKKWAAEGGDQDTAEDELKGRRITSEGRKGRWRRTRESHGMLERSRT
jgi:hypothetical protein